MRIEVHRHGGFAAVPGRDVRVDVDTGTLAAEVSGRVADALARAGSDRSAETTPPARQGGDRRMYDVTVTDDDGRRELRFTEPLTPAQRDLVALLLSLEAGG